MGKFDHQWQPQPILLNDSNKNSNLDVFLNCIVPNKWQFLLSSLGTMQDFNYVCMNRSALYFVNYSLRGIGQVIFANNPVSGLLILIALFWQSSELGWMSLLGVIASTATAIVLNLAKDDIHNGIYGYNGILVSAAIVNFCITSVDSGERTSWLNMILLVIFSSSFTTILLNAINAGWAKLCHSPLLTLPFNIITFWFLIIAQPSSLVNLEQDFISFHLPTSFDYSQLIAAVFIGFGQIFFASKLVTGILIFVALAICTPVGATVGLLGSTLGLITGTFLATNSETIYQGLWCYNSILTAIAIGGIFYVPNRKSILVALVCTLLTAIITPFVQILLTPLGLPVLTLPFCLVVIATFIILQKLSPLLIPVSLHAISNPEEHRQLYLDANCAVALFQRKLELFMLGKQSCFWFNQAEVRVRMNLQYIFQAIDINNRQRISISKIKNYLDRTGQIANIEDFQYLVKFIDRQNLGYFNFPEFSEIILRYQYLTAKHQTYTDYFLPLGKSQYDPITTSEIQQVFARMGQTPPTKIQIHLLQQTTGSNHWSWHQFVKVLLVA